MWYWGRFYEKLIQWGSHHCEYLLNSSVNALIIALICLVLLPLLKRFHCIRTYETVLLLSLFGIAIPISWLPIPSLGALTHADQLRVGTQIPVGDRIVFSAPRKQPPVGKTNSDPENEERNAVRVTPNTEEFSRYNGTVSVFPSSLQMGSVSLLLATCLVIWALGFLIVIASVLLNLIRFAGWLSRSKAVESGMVRELVDEVLSEKNVQKRVRLFVGPFPFPAATSGMSRVSILLSGTAVHSFSRDELRWIVRHECAHIAKSDYAINMVLALLVAVFWFNPIVWIFVALFVSNREKIRDAEILEGSSSADRKEYATLLLQIGRSFYQEKTGGLSNAFMGAVGKLRERVEAALHRGEKSRFSKCLSCFAVLAIVWIVLSEGKSEEDRIISLLYGRKEVWVPETPSFVYNGLGYRRFVQFQSLLDPYSKKLGESNSPQYFRIGEKAVAKIEWGGAPGANVLKMGNHPIRKGSIYLTKEGAWFRITLNGRANVLLVGQPPLRDENSFSGLNRYETIYLSSDGLGWNIGNLGFVEFEKISGAGSREVVVTGGGENNSGESALRASWIAEEGFASTVFVKLQTLGTTSFESFGVGIDNFVWDPESELERELQDLGIERVPK